jgi:hypothetical protein
MTEVSKQRVLATSEGSCRAKCQNSGHAHSWHPEAPQTSHWRSRQHHAHPAVVPNPLPSPAKLRLHSLLRTRLTADGLAPIWWHCIISDDGLPKPRNEYNRRSRVWPGQLCGWPAKGPCGVGPPRLNGTMRHALEPYAWALGFSSRGSSQPIQPNLPQRRAMSQLSSLQCCEALFAGAAEYMLTVIVCLSALTAFIISRPYALQWLNFTSAHANTRLDQVCLRASRW